MDTTEKDIRNLFANSGELDRDEVAMLLLQLVERIQNLERAPQRTWVGLTNEERNQVAWSCGAMSADWLEFAADWLEFADAIEAKLKEKNT